jgi:intron-binding protein aquarius
VLPCCMFYSLKATCYINRFPFFLLFELAGKTDVAVQIIACLYHSFPTQRTIIITHSNAALNDIFQKVMTRGDIHERYMVRLGGGERELQSSSTHDFTKQGRVAYSTSRRAILLEQVQQLSESLFISSPAERGVDGTPAYTCETAEYFYQHHIQKHVNQFEKYINTLNVGTVNTDVSNVFPFLKYFQFQDKVLTIAEAEMYIHQITQIFQELAEYRPLELLRSQHQRADYLILNQARIVAMTCTHAAIARGHLLELGFEYDNVVMEEAGQMLEIESFIPLLLQRGGTSTNNRNSTGTENGNTQSNCRLKRCCIIGDHHQLPPVIQNMSLAKYSRYDQSLFARMIRYGVPYIQLDQQGRCRPEIATLFNWRYEELGNLDRVLTSPEYKIANAGLLHTIQLINVENFEGKGETSPTPYFYQNVGEAEYVVALFQYLILIGYKSDSVSILTTYNGQKTLIDEIISIRCGPGTPLGGIRPRAVSTVDQYQGQQNDIILLSLVRTGSTIGHLRDIRRLIVAVSRARLGLYVFCRLNLFRDTYATQQTINTMTDTGQRSTKLQLVVGEQFPTDREVDGKVLDDQIYEVDDVVHMGVIVHQMQENLLR